MSKQALTNYVAYIEGPQNLSRIGYLDFEASTIQPLSFASGTPIRDLYQVIEVGEANIAAGGGRIPLSSVKLLPPISGRDVLAVGKNYIDHAKEFNRSGFDSSDKVDQPAHPVIFTKRSTSIIASGDPIVLVPEFTQTLDYEGEIGVVIGKPGFRIPEKCAMDYVWGYTIINDITARERQRDHKQFYLGKSGDTYCPMGPVAVPSKHAPKCLRLTTKVNGQVRQCGTTEDLIFSIPRLISTLSEGQTLQPGDVLATGTPAGVGIGQTPPVFLKPGDEIEISVPQLGTLKNKVVSCSSASSSSSSNVSVEPELKRTPVTNDSRSLNGINLTNLKGKSLYYKRLGIQDGPPLIFIHGLGGTSDCYYPLISSLALDTTHSLHLFDLEGHGLSPSPALSCLSMESFAKDVKRVFDHAELTADPSRPATIIAHSMGCLIALTFAQQNPGLVHKLVLLGPPPSPLPEAFSKNCIARAATVRKGGMTAVVDTVVSAGTSASSSKTNPLAQAAVRLSLLSQDPEGYAKACTALAEATHIALPLDEVHCRTLIVTGEEDKVSPPANCAALATSLPDCHDAIIVLPKVGHWHIFEDVSGVANAVGTFLGPA